MLVWPCFSRSYIISRKAFDSNEVRRPVTSTRETPSACRTFTEKITRACLTLRRTRLYSEFRGRQDPSKLQDKKFFVNFHCRITTRSPRRQLSASPTRTISISGERYFKIVSVVG